MEKLAILSHVLYNKDLLDKTSTLHLYTIKKIKMSQSYYDKDSVHCISELKKRTHPICFHLECVPHIYPVFFPIVQSKYLAFRQIY